jgi:hypothetical protein
VKRRAAIIICSNNEENIMTERPGQITSIAIMTLVSGVLNLLLGFGLTVGVVVGTLFIGIICAPLTILPAVLGIFEIIYGVKLLSNTADPVKPSQTIAILEIVTILFANVVSAVIGVIVLVLYNDEAVKAYFAEHAPAE